MQKIWEGYISEELPLEMTLKAAYSQMYEVEERWIEIKDITLGEYIDECLAELEYAGYNLDQTPLKFLEDKFLLCKVSVKAPKEYLQLSESLIDIKKHIEICKNQKYPQEVIDKLMQTKNSIESELRTIK